MARIAALANSLTIATGQDLEEVGSIAINHFEAGGVSLRPAPTFHDVVHQRGFRCKAYWAQLQDSRDNMPREREARQSVLIALFSAPGPTIGPAIHGLLKTLDAGPRVHLIAADGLPPEFAWLCVSAPLHNTMEVLIQANAPVDRIAQNVSHHLMVPIDLNGGRDTLQLFDAIMTSSIRPPWTGATQPMDHDTPFPEATLSALTLMINAVVQRTLDPPAGWTAPASWSRDAFVAGEKHPICAQLDAAFELVNN